tara:strand:- start:403 stop:1668 length:1266 start_codon:yes stop_codon:yes gene_type:complete
MKKKYLIIFIALFFLISPLFIISKINNAGNLPKYQQKLWSNAFLIFMELPDIIKSSFMIFSGKRNFSNLFNDYNVKFLPETQYLNIEFYKKEINFSKRSRSSFYIEEYKNSLIIITKNGELFRAELNDLSDKSKKLNTVKLNKKNLIKKDEKKLNILDSLIIDNKIYLTKTTNQKNCKKLSIVFSEISDDLSFKTLKEFKECALTGIGAGRIQYYKFNSTRGILLSTTDSDNDNPGSRAQDDQSIYGKIIFVNLSNGDHEIFSKGHRNPQGIAVKDDIIISTEHGPKGGDEINRIIYKKNYGWPIASYGYSYEKKDLIYKKSHEDNFFEEPLFVFLPSIGISELIILPNKFDEKWKHNALVTSLNGRSIYRVKFQNKNFDKILYLEEIYIGERIRDIKYINKFNIIITALERSGSVGILRK